MNEGLFNAFHADILVDYIGLWIHAVLCLLLLLIDNIGFSSIISEKRSDVFSVSLLYVAASILASVAKDVASSFFDQDKLCS